MGEAAVSLANSFVSGEAPSSSSSLRGGLDSGEANSFPLYSLLGLLSPKEYRLAFFLSAERRFEPTMATSSLPSPSTLEPRLQAAPWGCGLIHLDP